MSINYSFINPRICSSIMLSNAVLCHTRFKLYIRLIEIMKKLLLCTLLTLALCSPDLTNDF